MMQRFTELLDCHNNISLEEVQSKVFSRSFCSGDVSVGCPGSEGVLMSMSLLRSCESDSRATVIHPTLIY